MKKIYNESKSCWLSRRLKKKPNLMIQRPQKFTQSIIAYLLVEYIVRWLESTRIPNNENTNKEFDNITSYISDLNSGVFLPYFAR